MIIQENIREGGHYDIIVAGGGVAGVAAALQAAREGQKVLLLEKSQKLGGLATLGLINLFVPMCNGRGKRIIAGMAEEMLQLSIRYGYGGIHPDFAEDGNIPADRLEEIRAAGKEPPRYMTRYSAEIFALALTELCVNTGIALCFDTVVSLPLFHEEGGRIHIDGVVVENKSGRTAYTADYFVDATGDGDLMFRAGIPTLARGNFHTYIGFCITLESCARAAERKNIASAITQFSGGGSSLYGHGHPADIPLYSGTEAEEVNRYLIANQLEMLEKLKGQDRNSRDMVTLPGMAQFRTTRCIAGEYTLREGDAYRHFDDSVGAICDFDRRDYLYEIPYRTLISRKSDNLITCGRSASGEGYGWDVLRVIPPAIITGQAAGFACALAEKNKKSLHAVFLPDLQQKLADAGVLIHFDDADRPEHSASAPEFNDS